MKIETLCVQGNRAKDDITGAITLPIYQTATFAHPGVGASTGYDYSRTKNPTREQLENILAELEEGVGGTAFSSGMAAITAVMELFKPGDHIVVSDDLYGGSYRLFHTINEKNGLEFTAADTTRIEHIESAVKENTKALFIETPSNPMMLVSDIKKISKFAKEKGLLVIVDNTFLTPYLQKPLVQGADIVVHSGTKYLCGHNDTLAGFVVVNSEELNKKIRTIANTTGACLSPFDSWLLIRGIKTLPIRIDRQQENAQKIVAWLKEQACIKKVYYAAGAMISFEADTKDRVIKLLESVHIIRYAESLGGVESLITYPTLQTHADIPVEIREAKGINECLLRISVGVEAASDLIQDLRQGLYPESQATLTETRGYDFDKIIERKNTNSLKYDFATERGKPEGLLPLWVADMDFQAPREVRDSLKAIGDHGIFGYSEGKEAYFLAIQKWMNTHFAWSVDRNWLVKTPGVVYAIACAIKGLTKPGEAVLIQQPVYYPFSEIILNNDRKLINSPLVNSDGKYYMDEEDFERKIVKHDVKLFVLCNPHNPVGRVWTKEELICIGDICFKHGVYIVSDEIHADFIYEGHKHLVFADLKKEYADITITCTSPSKTFNLAGLQVSNIFISNSKLRRIIKKEIAKTGYSQLNVAGLKACQAAYTYGEDWLKELQQYLAGNLEYVRTFVETRLKNIELIEPEGTYLVWLDFRKLGLSEEQREKLILEDAKLWLDSGAIFGADGEGYERINIACPRETLVKAFHQLERVFG